jgi:hypothetical protein
MSMDNGIARDVWVVPVKREVAVKAAMTRQRFHEQRAKHWKVERDKTAKKLKQVGVQIVPDQFNNSTSVAVKYSSARHERVEVDGKLLQKLNNENGKVEEHKARAREYKRWLEFFQQWSGASLGFKMLDLQFFGLISDKLTGEGDD